MRIQDKSKVLRGSHTLEITHCKNGGAIVTVDGLGCGGAYVKINKKDVAKMAKFLTLGFQKVGEEQI